MGTYRLIGKTLAKRYFHQFVVCRSPVCEKNAKEQREARGCYRPRKRLRRCLLREEPEYPPRSLSTMSTGCRRRVPYSLYRSLSFTTASQSAPKVHVRRATGGRNTARASSYERNATTTQKSASPTASNLRAMRGRHSTPRSMSGRSTA